jgi:hypothetical protein
VIEAGDSASATISEMRCHFDVCTGTSFLAGDVEWTVDDSTVAQLTARREASSPVGRLLSTEPLYLTGRRPGRTILRVAGLPHDTSPSRAPIATVLEHQVIVVPAIGRFEILPRPDTVRVGDRLEFQARALDRAGRVIESVPVEWRIQATTHSIVNEQATPLAVVFDTPGRQTIVARVGVRTDSVVVTVVGRKS